MRASPSIACSGAAIERAARSRRDLGWLVFNADRSWPIGSASIDALLSINGRVHAGEAARVLRPSGTLLLALPAEDDQLELREFVLGAAHREDRVACARRALEGPFALECRMRVAQRMLLERDALLDLLAMTYRGQRSSQQERGAALERLEVQFSWDLLVWRRN